MTQGVCARFSRRGDYVHFEDTKINSWNERQREMRVMSNLIWLIRKAAVIETHTALPLFETAEQCERFTPYEQQSIVLYARSGRLDDLSEYAVTACDTRWDLIIPSSAVERQSYEQSNDPVYRLENQVA